MRIRSIFLLVFVMSMISCVQDDSSTVGGNLCPENDENYSRLHPHSQEFNLNLSVYLDLSDRINPEKYPNATMEYYKRDLGYLESLSHAFARHCRSKRFRELNERFQVFFHPPPSSREVNSIAKNLNLHLTKDNADKELICNLVDDYVTNTEAIYQEAISEGNFPGSDIWSFFENKAMRACVKEDARNILVILTDGYMYHEDSKRISPENPNQVSYLVPEMVRSFGLVNEHWESKMANEQIGYLPIKSEIKELEVLVLGLNPSKNNSPYEQDILKTFWSDWFNSIGVEEYRIELNDLPADLDDYIQNFILKVE